MACVGLVGIALGGVWFQMLTVFVTAVMVWELVRMIRTQSVVQGMILAAMVASVISGLLRPEVGPTYLWILLIPALAGAITMDRERVTFFFFALGIMIAGWGLVTFRDYHGVYWLFWLVLVVVVTDVGGYFGGKMLGGPKFWPKVSPKKTWSGILTGWVFAGLLGWAFMGGTSATAALIPVSVALSFASQMGDIAESALKRRMGVKDSSTLIPGHGGLFDRFDGLLGASLVMLLVELIVDLPKVGL